MHKRYAGRSFEPYLDLYIAHTAAMTAEGLHSKSDIAAELAYRDDLIAKLRAALKGVEWGAYNTYDEACCPDCRERQGSRHDPDCKLHAALAAAEEPPTDRKSPCP